MSDAHLRDTSRRQLPDRRRHGRYQGMNLRHIGLRPRRLGQRREADTAGHYVDWYAPQLLLSSLGVVACSCIDAFFTLQLLQMGAVELNLAMNYLIQTDVARFVRFKVGMTSLSVLLLVIHARFRVYAGIRVEHLLHTALAGYVLLICWELYMFANPPF